MTWRRIRIRKSQLEESGHTDEDPESDELMSAEFGVVYDDAAESQSRKWINGVRGP
jgi:hypothetical protein